jgi:pilus assembly protein Flp/PilA
VIDGVASIANSIGRAGKAARLFFQDRSAATSIEYGLLAAFMGLAVITAIGLVGTEVDRLFRVVLAAFPDN